MKNVSIIYGSTTGNTERVAQILKDNIKECNVTVANVTDASDEMIGADIVLFGSSTWGYGDLQDDFAPYYDKMDSLPLSGKSVAVFGCGDSASFGEMFCEAVNTIESKLEECGANVICDSLKVDGDVDENMSEIEEFAKTIR